MASPKRSVIKNSTSELLRQLNELKSLKEEREKRSRAKSDLLTYASTIEIPGSPIRPDDDECEEFKPIPTAFGLHHLLWIECLQKVEDGAIPRLLGMMPPGSAKSTYTSVVLPTHFMGRFPGSSVIVASYGSDLPRKFGRRARSIIKQPIYRRIFSTGLSQESTAADEWALTNGSDWMAAGILTGITGNRVDLVIWDDLIKGREQAESLTIRDKTWDAYFDDLLSRKKPHAREIGITTRWHEDDPAGRILPLKYNGETGWIQGRDGNAWYVVCLPAECERADDPLGRKIGEFIWPEWFPPGHFTPFKRNVRTWTSLYQQRPAPETGDFFKAEWLRNYDQMPDRDSLRVYAASDFATRTDRQGDYTVHIVVGIDPKDNIYILDLYRKQAASDEWVEAYCNLVHTWRPMGWAEESGQIRGGVGPFLTKRLRERRLYVVRAPFPSRVDKGIRAQSIRGRIAMNGLYCPFNAPWFPDFKAELMTFPNGNNDDQVDALSLIGQVLDKMITGSEVQAEANKPKIFSTDPETCTVTMNDMWEANDIRKRSRGLRIH